MKTMYIDKMYFEVWVLLKNNYTGRTKNTLPVQTSKISQQFIESFFLWRLESLNSTFSIQIKASVAVLNALFPLSVWLHTGNF